VTPIKWNTTGFPHGSARNAESLSHVPAAGHPEEEPLVRRSSSRAVAQDEELEGARDRDPGTAARLHHPAHLVHE